MEGRGRLLPIRPGILKKGGIAFSGNPIICRQLQQRLITASAILPADARQTIAQALKKNHHDIWGLQRPGV
jgi:hypothetical protein